jgi:putative transposase
MGGGKDSDLASLLQREQRARFECRAMSAVRSTSLLLETGGLELFLMPCSTVWPRGDSSDRPTPPVHLRLRGTLDEKTERLALRATLTAAHLFGVATGTHLRFLRRLPDPLAELQAKLQEAQVRERFAKIPDKHRPYYSPHCRFAILEIKNLLGWSALQTATVFLVCPNTVLNWETAADQESRTVGSTVKPTPPVRRAADVVRSLVQLMACLGFGGQDLTARILARAGWSVSARSVQRYRREKPVPGPPTQGPDESMRATTPVRARFVHHVWMMDVSLVRQFLGPDLFMAAVFDAFSRTPLALQVFETRPGAKDMARLLRRSANAFARPKHVVTDQGTEFTGGAFRKAVARLGALQRFCSKDSLLATARLERWWRTLKESASLYRLQLPLTAQDLEQRLEVALLHYVCFRPHEGLKGAVPVEAFLGVEPAHKTASEPPRARSGEGPVEAPFRTQHLDPGSGRFPILNHAA